MHLYYVPAFACSFFVFICPSLFSPPLSRSCDDTISLYATKTDYRNFIIICRHLLIFRTILLQLTLTTLTYCLFLFYSLRRTHHVLFDRN